MSTPRACLFRRHGGVGKAGVEKRRFGRRERTGPLNVVITGAAGFIGSHLVEHYLRRGDSVVGIDNFITGRPANLEHLRDEARLRFVEADCSASPNAVLDALGDERAGLVLHFASPASPVDYAQRPLETMAVNSKGTEACLVAAHAHGARLVYASTSESYGDPLEHPQRETYWGNVNPIGPRSCYDESKRFGEALVMSYIRVHDVDARIVRIFNTYGPRMRLDDGRVVPNFVMQALRGEPLTIYGSGKQTRSFCYVDDLVAGIARLADVDAARGRVVNIGNPAEYEIRKFGEIVAELAGVEFHAEPRPLPPDDPGRRCPDIALARELLSWNPKVDVRDGLQRTIAAFEAASRNCFARCRNSQ